MMTYLQLLYILLFLQQTIIILFAKVHRNPEDFGILMLDPSLQGIEAVEIFNLNTRKGLAFFLIVIGPVDEGISKAIHLAPEESTVVYYNNSNIDITNIRKQYQGSVFDLGKGLYLMQTVPPQCDVIFCKKLGNDIKFFKTCSPERCHCSDGQPHLQRCGDGTVFNPLSRSCNQPNIVGC
ncbi:unnamed protein product [Rotaria sp. Silwood1]|nr:unnamed protein product [Rotaria sp. Silwood1]CAF5052708.1 unnamed protein product [Rotaria sp. Silwood1]